MIRQLSRKISKHNMAKDWHADLDDASFEGVNSAEYAKAEKEMAKAVLRKRAAELGIELDTLTFRSDKEKKPRGNKLPAMFQGGPAAQSNKRRRSSVVRSETATMRRRRGRSPRSRSVSPRPQPHKPKCTVGCRYHIFQAMR